MTDADNDRIMRSIFWRSSEIAFISKVKKEGLDILDLIKNPDNQVLEKLTEEECWLIEGMQLKIFEATKTSFSCVPEVLHFWAQRLAQAQLRNQKETEGGTKEIPFYLLGTFFIED